MPLFGVDRCGKAEEIVWHLELGADPLKCPCCKGTMKPVRTFLRPEQVELFLRLHGLWKGVITLPRPPPPPFDIQTMEPIEPPWQAIKEWIPTAIRS